jgi:hypothetical protein
MSVDAWAEQLKDYTRAGSYCLECSVAELQASAADAGLVMFDADLKGIKGKQKFLNQLVAATQFPAEFGANWDALADGLCDLSWAGKPGYVLLLRNASDSLGLSLHDREIAQDIFADTVLYWQQRKQPFWVFFA